MQIFTIEQISKHVITQFNSQFSLTNLVKTKSDTHVHYIYLNKNDKIGYHQADTPQLLIILSGHGEVCSTNFVYQIVQQGDCIAFQKGEFHETKASSDLTALVIESDTLQLPI